MVLHFSSGGMPDRRTTTGIIFCGNNSSSELLKLRFLFFSKSRKRRWSSCSEVSAGFKSSVTVYLPDDIWRMCALALKIVGPESPKCVNSSSPKSV